MSSLNETTPCLYCDNNAMPETMADKTKTNTSTPCLCTIEELVACREQ